jgi:uncharacterized protein YecA (UPF0149 family)
MNLEEVDGFFAALVCAPALVPPSAELREKLIAGLSTSVTKIYRSLAPARQMNAEAGTMGADSMQRSKIGRNELCPCGPGKEYKRCCGYIV